MVVVIHQVKEELELRSVVPHNSMSVAMCERGTVTHRILRRLVDTLAAGEEDEPPPRVNPHEEVDADEVAGAAPPKNAGTAPPGRIQEPRGDDARSDVSLHAIFESRRVSAG